MSVRLLFVVLHPYRLLFVAFLWFRSRSGLGISGVGGFLGLSEFLSFFFPDFKFSFFLWNNGFFFLFIGFLFLGWGCSRFI